MRMSDWSSDVCSSDLRQAEAVLGERRLARVVAAEHAVELADGDVALVDEEEGVVRQVLEEGRRRLARLASGKVARVVLDAGAGAGRPDHLQVDHRALLQALRLQQLALLVEQGELDRSEEHTPVPQSIM